MDDSLRQSILDAFAKARENEYIPAACCCPGPAKIRGFKLQEPLHIVRVSDSAQKTNFVKTVKTHFRTSVPEALAMVNEDKVTFEEFGVDLFLQKLEKEGVSCSHIQNPTGKYPRCGCGMRLVCEYEGNFYEVLDYSADPITAKITLLGPVGGPYIGASSM